MRHTESAQTTPRHRDMLNQVLTVPLRHTQPFQSAPMRHTRFTRSGTTNLTIPCNSEPLRQAVSRRCKVYATSPFVLCQSIATVHASPRSNLCDQPTRTTPLHGDKPDRPPPYYAVATIRTTPHRPKPVRQSGPHKPKPVRQT